MKSIKNLVEYYEELFPITENQTKFYETLVAHYKNPVKFLQIFCGTGLFETRLAKQGFDITALEEDPFLLEAANLHRRTQLMAIRFFQMNHKEMSKFLTPEFYNIISVLNSRLIFLQKDELPKFFADCKTLLSKGGVLVLELLNFKKFENKMLSQISEKKSVRSKLFTEICNDNGKNTISMNLETGNGKVLNIFEDYKITKIMPEEIKSYAKNAGFSSVEFYADFSKTKFTGDEETFIAVLK